MHGLLQLVVVKSLLENKSKYLLMTTECSFLDNCGKLMSLNVKHVLIDIWN